MEGSPSGSNKLYGKIVLPVGAVILVSIILYFAYLFVRSRHRVSLGNILGFGDDPSTAFQMAHFNRDDGVATGIDEETLDSFPKMLYSEDARRSFKSVQGKEEEEEEAAQDKMCCLICLGEYTETEVVRVMPDCEHMFHVDCIDEWLRLHVTCPVCRTTPLPSRLSTSLPEQAQAPPSTILTVRGRDSIHPFPGPALLQHSC